MNALVSIIIGSTSDWPVIKQPDKLLNKFEILFEIFALSAHRTPQIIKGFTSNTHQRGIKVIIAGSSAHLPFVIADYTPLPIIKVPCRSCISIDNWNSILSILLMPNKISVVNLKLNASMRNAAFCAFQIIAAYKENIFKNFIAFKNKLSEKIVKANAKLTLHEYPFKTN